MRKQNQGELNTKWRERDTNKWAMTGKSAFEEGKAA